jgi:phage terminase large subunit-like protein
LALALESQRRQENSIKVEDSPLERYIKSVTYTPAQRLIFEAGIDAYRYGIYPKGRRLGATRGAAQKFIQFMLEGKKLLWGDVVQGNIRRYVDRYFKPALDHAGLIEGVHWSYKERDLVLSMGGGYTDFRSADHPERWEGFGYDVIFLNEAGLILDDDYLWKNAVLPMMLDNPNSALVAAGTPKLTIGRGLFFKELWDRMLAGRAGYGGRQFSSYDNPYLSPDDIQGLLDEIETELDQEQEVFGKFIDLGSVGQYFKRNDFTKIDQAPPISYFVRAWDLAATKPSEINPDPDYTVGVGLGVHAEGLTIVDVVKDRVGPAEVDQMVLDALAVDVYRARRVVYVVPVDPGAAGKIAFTHIKNLINEPYPQVEVVEYTQTKNKGSKAERAKPAVRVTKNKEVSYLPGLWNEWFFALLAAFPNPAAHDDPVDAYAAGVNTIELAPPPPTPMPGIYVPE